MVRPLSISWRSANMPVDELRAEPMMAHLMDSLEKERT